MGKVTSLECTMGGGVFITRMFAERSRTLIGMNIPSPTSECFDLSFGTISRKYVES